MPYALRKQFPGLRPSILLSGGVWIPSDKFCLKGNLIVTYHGTNDQKTNTNSRTITGFLSQNKLAVPGVAGNDPNLLIKQKATSSHV